MAEKLNKSDLFKIVCRFQGHPDIAGMALIETQGPNAMLAAAHWLQSKAGEMLQARSRPKPSEEKNG